MKIAWHNRILTRTLCLVLATSLLPLLLLGGIAIYFIDQDAKQKAEASLLISVENLTRQLERYFTRQSNDIKFLAGSFNRKDLNGKENLRLLSAFTATHTDINTLVFVDKTGQYFMLYSRDEMLKKSDQFSAIQPLPDPVIRELSWHGMSYNAFGEPVVTGSIPILAPWEKEAAGTLLFVIRPQQLHERLGKINVGNEGEAFIVDETDRLVSHSNPGTLRTDHEVSLQPEIEMLHDKTADDLRPRLCRHQGDACQKMISAYQKISAIPWGVVVEWSESEVYGVRNRLLWLVAVAFFMVMLVVTPLAVWFTLRLTTPLTRLVDATKELARGNLSARIDVSTADEIGMLARTFNNMAELRQKSEDDLQKETEKLSVTLRSIGDGVIATDFNGRVVLINKIAETLTGWRQEEAAGKLLGEVFNIINEKTRNPCVNPVDKVISSGRIIGLANHTALIARDGTERSIADSGAPIFDRESRIIGVILVFRDITDQLRMEEELLKVKKLESVGVLAGGIAHDFNNILAAILGNINLASLFIKPEDEKVHDLLKEAEKASLRARDLTQRLLTFAKGGDPVKKTASIAEIIKDTAGFVLRGSNVRCEYHISQDLWPVEVDASQMSQVIQNIILNAKQAMPAGGVIDVSCENFVKDKNQILPLHAGEYVKISITDKGIGIADTLLEKIFDPYFTTKQTGSGLGLAIAHSIVMKHDGYILVKSRQGAGTTFTIYLRASKGKNSDEQKEA
ncbi:MAG: ATP-binding protein, partial [Desulfobulbaceae bacterium]|nr:ATP-binding protein [Desulfobulbaceae bacterium]